MGSYLGADGSLYRLASQVAASKGGEAADIEKELYKIEYTWQLIEDRVNAFVVNKYSTYVEGATDDLVAWMDIQRTQYCDPLLTANMTSEHNRCCDAWAARYDYYPNDVDSPYYGNVYKCKDFGEMPDMCKEPGNLESDCD